VFSFCLIALSAEAQGTGEEGNTRGPALGDSKKDATGKLMLFIPGGELVMGDARGPDDDEQPPHLVRLTQGFWMDQHEVTRGEYQACVKAGRCLWPLRKRKRPIKPLGKTQKDNWALKYCPAKAFRGPPDHPVACLNYNEARWFCDEWRSARLPTEAEWEWAARGGLDRKRYTWGAQNPSHSRAHYGRYTGTGPVGRYPPNGYNLFDMAGSVWEWTSDWYDNQYYQHSPKDDPKGPCAGEALCPGHRHKTMRGGSWITGTLGLRLTYRNHHNPWNRFTVVGVRCVIGQEADPAAHSQP
jgi:formylglycine-generating enzyme required for sulfatase activity